MNTKLNNLNDSKNFMEFTGSRKGTSFVAAVKFERQRVELIKAPGFEKNENLNSMPSITWWWYEVDMLPKTILLGSWDLKKMITLKCRHYLATREDTSWIGIIVRDSNGEEKWQEDYLLREGKVVDPRTKRILGNENEEDVNDVIKTYLRTQGFLEE
jgi:hypothetical protein